MSPPLCGANSTPRFPVPRVSARGVAGRPGGKPEVTGVPRRHSPAGRPRPTWGTSWPPAVRVSQYRPPAAGRSAHRAVPPRDAGTRPRDQPRRGVPGRCELARQPPGCQVLPRPTATVSPCASARSPTAPDSAWDRPAYYEERGYLPPSGPDAGPASGLRRGRCPAQAMTTLRAAGVGTGGGRPRPPRPAGRWGAGTGRPATVRRPDPRAGNPRTARPPGLGPTRSSAGSLSRSTSSCGSGSRRC